MFLPIAILFLFLGSLFLFLEVLFFLLVWFTWSVCERLLFLSAYIPVTTIVLDDNRTFSPNQKLSKVTFRIFQHSKILNLPFRIYYKKNIRTNCWAVHQSYSFFLLCNLLMISNWCLSFCITLLLLYFRVKERNMNSKTRWYHIVLSSLHPHVISQFSMSIETLFLVSFYGRKGSTRNNF